MIDKNGIVREKFGISKQLCWSCKNAVPDHQGRGCSWSKRLEPVEGWTAKPSRNTEFTTWKVKECPEYIPEEQDEEPDTEEEEPVVKVKPKPKPVKGACGYWLRDGM